MKSLFRNVLFTVSSLYITIGVLGGLDLGNYSSRNFMLLAVGLTMLELAIGPILSILSLPSKGIGFWLINILLTSFILYVLTLFISIDIVQTRINLGFLSLDGQLVYTAQLSVFFCTLLSFYRWSVGKK